MYGTHRWNRRKHTQPQRTEQRQAHSGKQTERDVHTMHTPSATITTIHTGVDESPSVSTALELKLLATVVGPVVVLGIVGEVEGASFASGAKSCMVSRGAVVMVVDVMNGVVVAASVILGVVVVVVVVVVVMTVVGTVTLLLMVVALFGVVAD